MIARAQKDLTYEELKHALHKWAIRFQCRRFERWELINAVWAEGRVQKLPHIEWASQAVRWSMIRYMREQSKQWRQLWAEKHGRHWPITLSFQEAAILGEKTLESKIAVAFSRASHNEPLFQPEIPIAGRTEDVDNWDCVAWLVKGCTQKEKELLVFLYGEGRDMVDIGQECSVTGEAIRKRRNKLLNRLKDKMLAECA